jgi:F-type H+-transporting ATPase subunit a
MSDAATPVTAPADAVEQQSDPAPQKSGLSTKAKVFIGLGVYLGIAILMVLIFGSSGKNEAFQPQNEFKLEPWVSIHLAGIDLSINKAVLYLVFASALTIFTMVWISRRMHQKPGRVQTAMEVAYDMTKNTITGGNLEPKMASRWFPFLAALFFWIWFSNMIGFLPLPTNTEHTVNVFGAEIPSFAIYAATANLSIPLVLTLVVWVSYHVEGVRAKGLIKYLASWLPPGLEDMNPAAKGFIFIIEAISHFARLISLSVRLFANILAGHLLLLFMGGGLAVLLGIAALGALTFPLAFFFFILEVGLIATLQAFIFSTLTAIYLGGATSASH